MNENSQKAYLDSLKTVNFRKALLSLKEAAESLERTNRKDLAYPLKKIGKDILLDAYNTLPENLWKQLSEIEERTL
jgi:hypothetical protein